jgi:hypothetical protein
MRYAKNLHLSLITKTINLPILETLKIENIINNKGRAS